MSISDIYEINNVDYDFIEDLYFECIDSAILELNNSRKEEGSNIQISLDKNLEKLNKSLDKISDLSTKNMNLEFNKYNDKIKNLIADANIEESRLYQEIAIMIEKKDINEELVRLDSHFKLFKNYFKLNGQIGKKIN